jgi:methionine biosynthesis protein MetW
MTTENYNSIEKYSFDIISRLIKPSSRVIDVGCLDGKLLEFLIKNKNIDGKGIEKSHSRAAKALLRGVSVAQGNLEELLSSYPNKNFDYAIFNDTLQSVDDPYKAIREALRIANYVIIFLENFAYIKNRLHLCFKGIMPIHKISSHQWYEAPNAHFCSIKDFENLAKKLNFSIEKKIFKSFFGNNFARNLFSTYGIFLIKKNEFAPIFQPEFSDKKFSTKNLFSSGEALI